jgi:hypothetical protein
MISLLLQAHITVWIESIAARLESSRMAASSAGVMRGTNGSWITTGTNLIVLLFPAREQKY